jgi:hypothetical protein
LNLFYKIYLKMLTLLKCRVSIFFVLSTTSQGLLESLNLNKDFQEKK